ncbi:ComEC/Rec2 family competence protein [Microbacterium sp. SA39]|uniref:ComEC/Rec2 family competence protein n=1 Tax=Microbacterium sp. SA39 TaxID=1263625 RepID=UPI0005F9DD18|nr:ComEC/Rec2 family competence protein [Microbacterium sp. SA39]KJQ55518.1 ComEC family competence protein [Microbacterium sp. SA39]
MPQPESSIEKARTGVRRRDLRLLPLAGGVWAAALLCVFVPATSWWVMGGCGVGVVLTVIVTVRGASRWRQGAGLVVLLLAAMSATAVTASLVHPARERAAEWSGRVLEVAAEVTSSASVGQDGQLWFDAQTTSVGIRGEPASLSVPVRIGVEPGDGFDLGAGIRVVGQAMATDAGERSALVVFATEAEVVEPAGGVFGVAAGARQAFIDRSVRLPEPGAGLLPGLAVGDTRAVTEELTADMRTSGLSHLTAVSGANCAIVVGAVFWLTALCGGGRMLRVALAAIALSGFVVLVTPEPSVIRASVMAGVAMLAVMLGRPSAGAGMLALCAVMILLVDPWLAATPGFALSVVASGALILLAPPLSRGLTRWMPAPVALAVAVPLAAQLACGPIIALFADQQSLIGIAANLIAAPAAPVATVIGLLACLAAPVPPLADLLTASAWLPAAWIATTASTTARLPVAELPVPAGIGSSLLVLGVSGSLAVALVGTRVAPGIRTARLARLMRGSAASVLIVVVSLAAARLVLTGPLATATVPDGWAIAACDVGQGDALLVRSGEEVALIDAGPDPELLGACLTSLGITHVDLLVFSHFDLDHVGGAEAVYGKVDAVLHGPIADAADQRLLDGLAARGAKLTQTFAGQRGVLGSTDWRVLWPLRDSAVFPAGNDASVVMEFRGGAVPRSMFLGDLSAEAQRMLQRSAHLDKYSVVKVAHHGSADQDPGLYEAADPAAAIFTAGTGNDYGHPRADALDLLTATGSLNLRTDTQGRVLLGLRDDELQVWTEKAP